MIVKTIDGIITGLVLIVLGIVFFLAWVFSKSKDDGEWRDEQ